MAVSAAITSPHGQHDLPLPDLCTNAGGTSKGSDETFATLPNPPTVVTKPASSIAQTTSTLNATVNPNSGNVTTCEFEYGTTNAYGKSAPCAALPGSGTTAVAVSAAITALTANTTYHFRISATNAGGTSKGSDETFATLPNAPTVEAKPTSSITQTTATLNATVNPNGGEVSECKFEYGTTNAYGSSAVLPLAGLGHERRRGLGGDHGPDGQHDLPLPDLSDQRRAARAKARMKRSRRCPNPRRSKPKQPPRSPRPRRP